MTKIMMDGWMKQELIERYEGWDKSTKEQEDVLVTRVRR